MVTKKLDLSLTVGSAGLQHEFCRPRDWETFTPNTFALTHDHSTRPQPAVDQRDTHDLTYLRGRKRRIDENDVEPGGRALGTGAGWFPDKRHRVGTHDPRLVGQIKIGQLVPQMARNPRMAL